MRFCAFHLVVPPLSVFCEKKLQKLWFFRFLRPWENFEFFSHPPLNQYASRSGLVGCHQGQWRPHFASKLRNSWILTKKLKNRFLQKVENPGPTFIACLKAHYISFYLRGWENFQLHCEKSWKIWPKPLHFHSFPKYMMRLWNNKKLYLQGLYLNRQTFIHQKGFWPL